VGVVVSINRLAKDGPTSAFTNSGRSNCAKFNEMKGS